MTDAVTVQVVAHRGWWRERGEQNTRAAFDRALSAGFGIETDLWWRDGDVVVSHDPPRGPAMTLRELVASYDAHGSGAPLALNAKCDALYHMDRSVLARLAPDSWFFFDMSVPDMLGYRTAGLPFFTRHSELEPDPALYGSADGVWLDQFTTDWVDAETLARHASAGKAMCIVSPELHGRPYEAAWAMYRTALRPLVGTPGRVMLCTDHPQLAKEFFTA